MTAMTAAIAAALALSPAGAEPKPQQSGQLDNVSIEGESRMRIRQDKLDEIPPADPKKPLEEFLAQNSVLSNPADRLLAKLPILLPPRAASDLVVSPWRTHLWSPPVLYLVVKNAPSAGVKSWRLVVTNDKGKAFRTLGGRGRIPEHIEWDGLSDSGEPLQVGHSYSCALSVLDRMEVPLYLTSKTVRLGSYVDEHSNRVRVLLDSQKLFAPGPVLTEEGKARLSETRDLIRSHFRSIKIEVFDDDADLAQRQADLVRKTLEEGLHLNEGSIPARGRSMGKDRYARTEVLAK